VNPNDKNVRVTYTDEVGDSWEEHNVFHPKFVNWLEQNNYDVEVVKSMNDEDLNAIIEKSPYHKATSNDIDWVNKVKMQGAVQKWVDHSISVTVNIPADTKEELVSTIYQTAWESGCKGMTIYREGSRGGVLVSKSDKKKETIVDNKPASRPKVLEADIVRFQNDYDKWIAVVGLYNGKPYEIFTGRADDFYLPPSINKGFIVKVKDEQSDEPTRYDFEFLDKQGYRITIEGLSRTFDEKYWNYAILISGILRHGMPITEAVDLIAGLKLGEDSINTWKNGVVRALRKYIPDGTVAEKVRCPECNESNVVYKEGCLTCTSCGYSKCG
jgi:ribonucleoside-diphosphate reductase alpha chain